MKIRVYIVLAVFTFAILATACASAKSSEDYRIIKNAVKGSLSAKSLDDLWLHISIKENDVETVRISVPFILVKYILEKKPDCKLTLKEDSKIKLADLLKMLDRADTKSLLEVSNYKEKEMVRIWIGDEDSCIVKE